MKARASSIALPLSWCLFASAARGQAVQANGQPEPPVEIVVTATRRATPLQKTPKSMSAVSGKTLDDSGSRDVNSLPRLMPGLTTIDGGSSNMRVAIRGIQAPGEATVGVYYDETPVSGSVGVASDPAGSTPKLRLVDVERVELLRGPQGTLYGSGSLGGALKVLFKRPVPWLESRVGAGAAYTEHGAPSYQLDGMLNVPVVDDRLAARAVVFAARRGGYVDNTFLGRNDVDGESTWGARLLLRFTPSSKVTLDAGYYYQQASGEIPIWNYGRESYQSIAQVQRINRDRLSIYNLTGRWDAADVQATSVISFARRNLEQVGFDSSYFYAKYIDDPEACARLRGKGRNCSAAMQADFNDYARAFIPSLVYPTQTTDVGSAELRLSSRGNERLLWTLGGFASVRHGKLETPTLAADPTTGAIVEPRQYQFQRFVDERLRQLAAFIDASYRLVPAVSLAAGIRYFIYEREVGGYTPRAFDLLAPAAPLRYYDSQETGAAPRLSLAYQATPRALLYGEAAQGFRPGGVNQVLGLPRELESYKADKTWNYELGAKTSWLGGRLIANADAFLIDWYDMQVAGSRPDGSFRFVSNAGRARIVGAESELQLRPVRGLELRLQAAYTRARLSEDQSNGSVASPGRKGDRIPYIPQLTAGFSAQYKATLAGMLRGSARADLSYVGGSFSELRPDNTAYHALPSYWLLGVRVGLEREGGDWGGQLFIDNALDQVAVSWLTAPGFAPGQLFATSAPPRTAGISVYKRF